jgi:hypothetical protein
MIIDDLSCCLVERQINLRANKPKKIFGSIPEHSMTLMFQSRINNPDHLSTISWGN